MNASRALRRAPAAAVSPALIRAMESHKDQFVRFRALVLLTGFNDARTAELVREIVTNPNDRLRTVAYMYYEHHPTASMLPALLKALEREESEFVRPALVRALAAQGSDPRVRETLLVEVGRGQDFFRSGVIEALGDYRAAYAVEPLMAIARLTGPLQADAVIALGKLKDQRAMETLAALQRSAPRESQPTIAAAICLLGINCDAHVPYLIETLQIRRQEPGLSGVAAQHRGCARRAREFGQRAGAGGAVRGRHHGRGSAARADGARSRHRRHPEHAADAVVPRELQECGRRHQSDRRRVRHARGRLRRGELLRAVRRGYWKAAESSPTRRVGQALIDKLEF